MGLMKYPYFELYVVYEDGSRNEISAYLGGQISKETLSDYFNCLVNKDYLYGFTVLDEFKSISLKNYREIVIKIYDTDGQEIRF